ncbi:MAG: DUF1254 domain-containing protein [Novosphingobium sp.]
MRHSVLYGLLFSGAAIVGHIGTVIASPYVIMHVAMKRLSGEGAGANTFRFAERVTSSARQIVRPSPDLAYASCVYDLSTGPILVDVPASPSGGYLSVSVFAANTDNVAAFDSLRSPNGIRFILQKEGTQAQPADLPVIYTPSERGIILDRRLAPTKAAFDLADKARRMDRCAPIG